MIKQNDNKLAISVVATLTAGIALIYILVAYPQLIFAVAGVSAIFLICAYILTQNIIGFINMKNKSLNVQIKNGMDDLSSQIEGMSSAQAQLGKATYLYTRQTAENVATLRGNYTDSQAALHKNLSVLANAQNKSTKLLIKYDQSNTTKLISTLKDIKNHLSDTFSQGFEQIPQADNADVVNMLESIVEYLKTQPENMDQALSMQINNVAHELQNISINISKMQSVPMQPYMPVQQMTMQPVYQEMPQMQPAQPAPAAPDNSLAAETVAPIAEQPVSEPSVAFASETIVAPAVEQPVVETSTTPTVEAATPVAETPTTPTAETTAPVAEASTTPTVETAVSAVEASTTPTIEAATPVAETSTTPAVETTAPATEAATTAAEESLPGLTAADLDALYAEAEQNLASETAQTQPTVTETKAEQPKTAEPVAETATEQPKAAEPAPEPVQVAPVSDDPNKQLSADEIAALFAAAEPAPKKEEPAPAPEPVQVAPVSDDPNKQLSPDEIAALFAAAEPAPKKEETAPDNNAEEEAFTPTFTVVGKSEPKEVKEEPVTPTVGDMSDPNKQLSPDEIAALFAAAEPAPKKDEPAPEPVQVAPVSDDPNKQLSADEIAALFAAAEPAPKKEEPAPEPVQVTPVSDDPNKQLSPDEIAALFASIG